MRIWSTALLAAFAFNPVPTGSATIVTSHWTESGAVAHTASGADAAMPARPETLTILTYNVQDLPLERHVLFDREDDGSMLSDHIGYSVTYRLMVK